MSVILIDFKVQLNCNKVERTLPNCVAIPFLFRSSMLFHFFIPITHMFVVCIGYSQLIMNEAEQRSYCSWEVRFCEYSETCELIKMVRYIY